MNTATEYIVKQGFETDTKGYDNRYWYVQAADGRAVVGLENEQAAESASRALNDETANLRNRNMELEAALAVTTESLNKANYEKYLLEVAIKEAIEKSIPKDTTLGDCAWALINCRETLQNALKEKQAPVSSDSDEQFQEPDFDEIYRQQIEKDNEDIP